MGFRRKSIDNQYGIINFKLSRLISDYMHQMLIPQKRAELLEDKAFLQKVSERLGCEIKLVNGNELVIEGEAFNEYIARSVMQAFARGFEFEKACKLLSDDYLFESIDMKQLFKNDAQIKRIKARVIGKEGKAKSYIQSVSGVELVVYGDTVSMIGTLDEMRVAKAALNILLEGGTHSAAYAVMEKTKRRLGEN